MDVIYEYPSAIQGHISEMHVDDIITIARGFHPQYPDATPSQSEINTAKRYLSDYLYGNSDPTVVTAKKSKFR